ncbi:MAG: proteasome subunit beta [Candidatus Kariarchaeaceae archaeon]
MNTSNFNDPTREYKHGTTTVALAYKDGIVAAADKRASMGYMVASPAVKKILQLDDRSVLTIAGLPSDAMYLVKVMRAEMGLYELNRGRAISMKGLANLFSTIMHGQFRTGFPYFVGVIIAGVDETGGHVYNFDGSGSISDDPYTSTGSGSPFAYGTLEALYNEDMEEAEAIRVAAMAVRSAAIKDIASGDGITLFVINKDGTRELTREEIEGVLGDRKFPFTL